MRIVDKVQYGCSFEPMFYPGGVTVRCWRNPRGQADVPSVGASRCPAKVNVRRMQGSRRDERLGRVNMKAMSVIHGVIG